MFLVDTLHLISKNMVYYFMSSVVDPPAQIYVGKDKVENEDLIKYGLEQDVWYVIQLSRSTMNLSNVCSLT